jgi:hypothetical protein
VVRQATLLANQAGATAIETFDGFGTVSAVGTGIAVAAVS